ncbi:hypothetical protein BASA81_008022 [Batrachochytrium salamandrivorans]|nr:hypothetical protein BASA81_008022 [Batrachochytrium salamandrivorans]
MGCGASKPLGPTPVPISTAHTASAASLVNEEPALPTALHFIQSSAFFHGLSDDVKQELAQRCELSNNTSPALGNWLLLGFFFLRLGQAEIRKLDNYLVVGEGCLMPMVLAPHLSPTLSPMSSSLSSNTVLLPPITSSSPSTTLNKQPTTSSLPWRRSMLQDAYGLDGTSNSLGWDVAIGVPETFYKLHCSEIVSQLEDKHASSLLITRAQFRDPQYLAKLTMFQWLFTSEFSKEYARFCELFAYKRLEECAMMTMGEKKRDVLVVIDGVLEVLMDGVLLVELRAGQVGMETLNLFANGGNTSRSKLELVVKQSGVALCLDTELFNNELLPKLPPVVRQRFEDESSSRLPDHLKLSFHPWLTYMSSEWLELVLAVATCVVLQDGQPFPERHHQSVLLIRSGEVLVSHSMKRKSSSGAFVWAREDNLIKQMGEMVIPWQAMDRIFDGRPLGEGSLFSPSSASSASSSSIFSSVAAGTSTSAAIATTMASTTTASTATTTASTATASTATMTAGEEFEIKAVAKDTRVYVIPADLIRAALYSCKADNKFAADFELRVLRDQAKFDHILLHPVSQFYFRQYLDYAQATENLDFWLAEKEFAQSAASATTSNSEQMATEADKLFTEFVAANSPKQINLPAAKRLSLETSLMRVHSGAESIPKNLFQAASQECYSLMNGCVPRFLKSEFGQRMFQSITLGTSLQDCRYPPSPVVTSQKELSPLKRNSSNNMSRSWVMMEAGGGGSGGGSWRQRAGSSPRLSFSEVSSSRRSVQLTPRSGPLRSPLSGMADIKVDD